ncbi:GspE/PulE family protein [Clostridium sp. MB40-C1]|uniref:GspE/PulE family protein n=1 Tax=Clostridium sp. MB40-C1 TaxID=3070996 RepID=UPI0027DF7BAC|nr:GspE/PulE family protein [Clostridium sp. MB40-C1]WMJ81386.1 GspE/PulE family protein [Clostridium sp. MB40-C1]
MNKLKNALIKDQVISLNDYNEVLEIKDKTKEELLHILIENNYVERDLMYKILKDNFNINSIELDNTDVENDVIKVLPEDIARKYNVMPFKIKDSNLLIAMVDPLNEIIIDDIRFITNKDVIPYIERKNKIIYAIETYYNKGIEKEALKTLKTSANKSVKVLNAISKNFNNDIEDSPIVRVTNSIIYRAIDKRASDIHLEPFEDFVNVRYRIDGVLKLISKIPSDIYPAVCSRIKTIAGMDISKKLLPQDGKINLQINNEKIDFRVSSIPTIHGEKLVLRILYRGNNDIDLSSLDLSKEEYILMKKILSNSSGIILITGPTGSGKTTTLYSMLNEINSEERNIVTIEDPVEYTINGINQINVNYKSGLNFAQGLRSLLRQDPDVIMVGEIRDEETAQIAVRSAITGHLVFSTLHTNSAFTAVERLINMDIPVYLAGDALVAVIYQRLIRKICPYCKEEYIPEQEELNFLRSDTCKKLFRGKGCLKCSNTGYKGRKAVFEIMYLDSGHRKLIFENKSTADLRDYSIKNGAISLKNKCKNMVLHGTTTVREMMKITYENV